MCSSKQMNLFLTIPLLIIGIVVAFNFPELRRYFHIYRM